jgi:telomerase reverse transcriptase
MDPLSYEPSACTISLLETQKLLTATSKASLAPGSTRVLPRKPSMMDHATPSAMVSAFCRAVLHRLVPHEFWGVQEVQTHNEAIFHRNVDRFIGLRRFESLSLHEVSQGIRVKTTTRLPRSRLLTLGSDRKYSLARASQV